MSSPFSPKQELDPRQRLLLSLGKQLFTTPQQLPDPQRKLFTPQKGSSKQHALFTPQREAQKLFTPEQTSSFEQTSAISQLTPQQQQHLLLQLFQQQQQQQQLQSFQQQHQFELHLVTNQGASATYSTKLADLHPDSLKLLLQVEERIMEHRQESQRLEQCSRLYDYSVSSYGFESDARLFVQELGGISTAVKQQKAVIEELFAAVKNMLSNTAFAVHSFLMLRPRFLHPKSSGILNSSASIQASGATSVMGTDQLMTTFIGPVFDFYSGVPKKPSPFLQQTVARFDKYLVDFYQLIKELEQLLIVDADRNDISSSSSLLQALPKVISNGHDFFMHVAAKVERIHQHMESMRTTYLAEGRRKGLYSDPFLDADRRETAKEEVAAKRVQPTLRLPAISQLSNQVSGLISIVPSNPQAIAAASPGVGISSLFDTPYSGSSSSPLFWTPVADASTAGQSYLFDTPSAGSSSFPLSTTPATAASLSLFGDSITPVQSSLSGVSTPTVGGALFRSTPSAAVSSSRNLFDTGWPTYVSGKASKHPRSKSGKQKLPPISE